MSADFRTWRLEPQAAYISPYLQRPLRSYAECLRQRMERDGSKGIRRDLAHDMEPRFEAPGPDTPRVRR